MYTYIYTYIHIHMYTYICTHTSYTYIHIHMHTTCIYTLSSPNTPQFHTHTALQHSYTHQPTILTQACSVNLLATVKHIYIT